MGTSVLCAPYSVRLPTSNDYHARVKTFRIPNFPTSLLFTRRQGFPHSNMHRISPHPAPMPRGREAHSLATTALEQETPR